MKEFKSLKQLWVIYLGLLALVISYQHFIPPMQYDHTVSEYALNILHVSFLIFGVFFSMATFFLPSILLRDLSSDEKMKSFSIVYALAMGSAAAVSFAGFILHWHSFYSSGYVLNALGVALLILKRPRLSQVESILGEELASSWLKMTSIKNNELT